MIQITEDDIAAAKDRIATGNPSAVGYRLLVYPIMVEEGLEAAEAVKFEKLKNIGFITKTSGEAERQSKGSHYGILLDIGDFAWATEMLGKKPWVSEGDTLVFGRYAGVDIEMPPGSGQILRFMSDENVLGRML